MMTVTPVILTLNEACNIESTLATLTWAARVVVLDSGSTDETERVARSFENVDWFVRKFDNHRAQWEYAIHETSILTDYVLALDADMRPTIEFKHELNAFLKDGTFDGASIPFEYRVLGRPLAGSIYPAQKRLFRKRKVRILQPGHSQNFEVDGKIWGFRTRLIHEDLKPLSRWLNNQINYAALEASRITSASRNTTKDQLRSAGLGPLIVGAWAFIKAGGPFRSVAAKAYACERLIFEAILARMLVERAQPNSGLALQQDQSVPNEAYDSTE